MTDNKLWLYRSSLLFYYGNAVTLPSVPDAANRIINCVSSNWKTPFSPSDRNLIVAAGSAGLEWIWASSQSNDRGTKHLRLAARLSRKNNLQTPCQQCFHEYIRRWKETHRRRHELQHCLQRPRFERVNVCVLVWTRSRFWTAGFYLRHWHKRASIDGFMWITHHQDLMSSFQIEQVAATQGDLCIVADVHLFTPNGSRKQNIDNNPNLDLTCSTPARQTLLQVCNLLFIWSWRQSRCVPRSEL